MFLLMLKLNRYPGHSGGQSSSDTYHAFQLGYKSYFVGVTLWKASFPASAFILITRFLRPHLRGKEKRDAYNVHPVFLKK